jgi:hypothetical protein
MEPTQLKADLSLITAAVARADVPEAVKRLLSEVIAWNEALVDQVVDHDGRIESTEASIDEILDGGGEMILPETAVSITSAFEHGQLLCHATLALLAGPLATAIDDVSQKRFALLIDNAQRAFALATQIVVALTVETDDAPAEGTQEETDAGGDDGDGDDADEESEDARG